MEQLRDRFRGALLGTMLGDAVGVPWEGTEGKQIAALCGNHPFLTRAEPTMNRAIFGLLLGNDSFAVVHYTDDTQMTLALAETLLAPGPALRRGTRMWTGRTICFAGNPTRRVLGRTGAPPVWRQRFVRQRCRHASRPTGFTVSRYAHTKTKGSCSTEAALETHETDDFREACRQIWRLLDLEIPPATVGDALGCDVSAIGSVPAALYSFLKYPGDFKDAVTYAVKIGGDTDTIAAMCGAISGAYLGASNLSDTWLSAIENGPQGRDYVTDLADRLFIVWQSS